MKAIRIHEFGGPEALKLDDIERPVPAADEILVKVYASGVNPTDWGIRNGGNEFLRSFLKLPMTLGWDAAGVIEDFGSDVNGFQKGDEIYGIPNFPGAGDGSYAEYCAAKATQFALKPRSLNFNQAAGVPLAALTAWTGLFAHGGVRSGQRVLILGASGSVGGFAVQFAKATGVFVIGTASGEKIDYVRQLGADEVIDYNNHAFDESLQNIDVVLEASPVRDDIARLKSVKVLKEGGILVSVNVDLPFSEQVQAALAKKNAKGELAPNQSRHDWLTEIAQMIDSGKVSVPPIKVFPLEQVAEAHRESETWHVRGKLILEIRKENTRI